ncbi:MAG: hypothetical protein FWE40_07425 [Oscillospiraceae bacterium]|nr:hypothetical protein [Oscillospiraceae bacterium]
MQRKKPSMVPVVLFAILSCLVLIIMISLHINPAAFPELTQENTTEFSATLAGVREGAGDTVIYSVEFRDRLVPFFRHDIGDFDHLKSGQTVFFRVENIWLEQIATMPFIPMITFRTEAVELSSLSSFNEQRAEGRRGLAISGIFWFSVFLVLTIFFAIRRKRSQRFVTPTSIGNCPLPIE